MRTLLLASLAALLAAAPASASFVKVDRGDGRVSYKADPGEANEVVVRYKKVRGKHRYKIKDPGATIEVRGSLCKRKTAHRAVCKSDYRRTKFSLGDGDDSLEYVLPVASTTHSNFGGGGTDTLTCTGTGEGLYRIGGNDFESVDDDCSSGPPGRPPR